VGEAKNFPKKKQGKKASKQWDTVFKGQGGDRKLRKFQNESIRSEDAETIPVLEIKECRGERWGGRGTKKAVGWSEEFSLEMVGQWKKRGGGGNVFRKSANLFRERLFVHLNKEERPKKKKTKNTNFSPVNVCLAAVTPEFNAIREKNEKKGGGGGGGADQFMLAPGGKQITGCSPNRVTGREVLGGGGRKRMTESPE